MRLPCFTACAVFFALPIAACAQNDKLPPLKIGLDRTFRHSTSLLLSADRAFTLKDSATNAILENAAPGAVYRMVSNDEGMTLTRIGAKQDAPVASNVVGPIELVPETERHCQSRASERSFAQVDRSLEAISRSAVRAL